MPGYEDRYETPKWRTLGLLVGFALLVGISIVAVAIPELEDEPAEELNAQIDDAEELEPEAALQE